MPFVGSHVFRTKTLKQWRQVHCDYCGADIAYEQTITGKGKAFNVLNLDTKGATAIADNIADEEIKVKKQSGIHGGVSCPECGTIPATAYQSAIKENTEKLGRRFSTVAVFLAASCLAFTMVWHFVIQHSPSYAPLVAPIMPYVFLGLVPMFFVHLFAGFFVSKDLNTPMLKSQRRSAPQPNVMLLKDFQAGGGKFPEEDRPKESKRAPW